jgi:hypothetical protein
MKCRFALVVLVAALAATAALAVPSESQAGTVAEDAVIDNSANWTAIDDLLAGTAGGPIDPSVLYDAAGGAGGTYDEALAQEIVAGLDDAAATAGIGGLGMAFTVPVYLALGAGAFYAGWQVGGAVDHWLGISDLFGPDPGPAGSNYDTGKWWYVKCSNNSGNDQADNPVNTNTYPVGTCSYLKDATPLSNGQATYVWFASFHRSGGSANDTNFFDGTAGGTDQDSKLYRAEKAVADSMGSTNVHFYATSAGLSAGHFKGSLWMTPAQMAKTRVTTSPVLTVNPGGTQVTVPHPSVAETANGACTSGSACATTVRTIIKTHNITEQWIVHQLDPTVEPDDPAIPPPVPLYQPLPNETYDDYIARLQTGGWLGTGTEVDETSPIEGYGPNAVTRVQYTPSGGTTTVLDPLNWPTTPITIPPGQDINVRVNTTDAIPAPTGGGGGSCSCPPIDFSPFQDISVGTSFPFGALNWFKDAMGSPSSTNLDFTLHLPIGDTDINTQSTWWEANRDTYYPIEEFLITVAFFFVFATRILHMGKADED